MENYNFDFKELIDFEWKNLSKNEEDKKLPAPQKRFGKYEKKKKKI